MDPIWEKVLEQARSGSMLHPPIGDLESANWRCGAPIPKTLILCDLMNPPPNLPLFPEEFELVEELDLSGNALEKLPENISVLRNLRRLFLGGFPREDPSRQNRIESLPDLSKLLKLEHLSVHDTGLHSLPNLPRSLQVLRVDRCPFNKGLQDELPPNLTTLHLEGCPLPGTLERPDLLPATVKKLHGLDDLQLPDGTHIGLFFGTPVAAAVQNKLENEGTTQSMSNDATREKPTPGSPRALNGDFQARAISGSCSFNQN